MQNVREINRQSDENPKSRRIAVDCKAQVKVGNLSRGGKSRWRKAKEADDHDMEWSGCLAPFGIPDMTDSDLSLLFGASHETSDVVVDCLEMWWESNRKKKYAHMEELVINLDNGPSQQSNRSQFIKRMAELAPTIRIPIDLVYYPPYHSKYNPIEHSFGVLERYWNGEILSTADAVLKTASNLTLRGRHPHVRLVDKKYALGTKLTRKELKPFESSFVRSSHLPLWDVRVVP